MKKTLSILGLLVFLFVNIFSFPAYTAASLFNDNFDDGNYTGWSTYEGTWSVSGGTLNVNSGPGYKAVSGQSFTNFVYEADVKVSNDGEAGIIFRVTNPNNGQDAFNGYYFAINAASDIAVIGKMNGSWTEIGIKKVTINNNTWYRLKVIVNGSNIIGYINDNPLNTSPYPKFDVTDSSFTSGSIGFRTWNGAASFDNVSVTAYEPLTLDSSYTNSVLDGCADPDVLYYNGVYYLYSTNTKGANNGFLVYSSTDLVNWENRGSALVLADSWGTSGFWAPDIIEKDGTFYMYYSVSEHLCVATSQSPLGPFKQAIKQPIHPNTKEIDGHVFKDDDGKYYFYFVRFNGGNEIWGAELNSDMMTINESTARVLLQPTVDWEKSMYPVNEGPYMLKHNGAYYLTYSGDHFQSANYGAGYATSSSPLGAFTKYANNPIMKSSSLAHGTGHHGITVSPDGSELYMVYHRHYSLTATEPRRLCIDRMKFVPQAGGPDVLEVYGPTVTAQKMPSGYGNAMPYFMIMNKKTGKALDLIGGDLNTGARINQWTFDYNGQNQRWAVKSSQNGHFNIVSYVSQKAAGVTSTVNGAQLQQLDIADTGSKSQQWDFIDAGNGWFRIKNVQSGKMLDVENSSTANDAKVQLLDNNGQDNQLWRLQPWGDYFIKADSGRYICVENRGSTNGNRIIQYSYQNNPWFKWRFENVGDGWYKLSSLNSINRCISIDGASTSAGAGTVLWEYNSDASQKIRIEPQTNGDFKFYFANSGMTWDIPGGQSGNNIQMEQYNANANLWQGFTLERTEITDPVPTPTLTSIPKPTATPTINEYTISGYIAPDFTYSQDIAPTVLQGFTVKIQGTSNIVLTDSKGYFELKGIKGGQSSCTLEISKNGYLNRLIENVIINKNLQIGSQQEPISIWAGDINQDGVINMADIMESAKAFNAISGSTLYNEDLDLNKDTAINMQDIMIVAKYFNKITSDYPTLTMNTNTPTPTQQVTFTNIPTPTSKPTPTSTPTSTPVNGNYPTWDGNGHVYAIGDRASYNGSNYECIMAHTSNTAWDPVSTLQVLWKSI